MWILKKINRFFENYLNLLLDLLCEYANSNMDGNLRVSDTHPVQFALTDLGMNLYVLESMVYYLGGLIDEELYLLNDVENNILQVKINIF